MLVYGNIDARQTPAQLVLEFWIAPHSQNRYEEVLGTHRLTTPIPILNPADPGLEAQPELQRQASAIAWIAIGLTHAQLGQTQAALEAFQKAEAHSPRSDVVQFFLGREFLFLAEQDPDRQDSLEQDAAQAFINSVSYNPDYARGYIGLGGIYFRRAGRLLDKAPSSAASEALMLLDRAIEAYQGAIDLKPDPAAYGVPVDSIARLGLGKSYRLKGEAHQKNGDDVQAGQFLDQAIQTLEPLIEPFSDALQERYLAQTYEGLGNAYFWKAYLFEVKQQYTESLAAYRRSLDYYDRCIKQGEASPDLIIKNDIAGRRCVPFRQDVQETIDSLSGGQG
jgi:tetratricopeptide (TPR) repeat protein